MDRLQAITELVKLSAEVCLAFELAGLKTIEEVRDRARYLQGTYETAKKSYFARFGGSENDKITE